MTTEDRKVEVRQAIGELIHFMGEASKNHKYSPEAYEVSGGRKYLRISALLNGAAAHAHCFVDSTTGDVYMAASYAKPALNGARFNLLDPNSLAELKRVWDPYGSYLYKKNN